jgi:hypothetical protein
MKDMQFWKKQLASLLLALLFISFTISGLVLINVVFTIAPFRALALE